MIYDYSTFKMEVEGHCFWVAKSKRLKGCVGQGETSKDAVRELEENEAEWIKTAKQFDIPLPADTVYGEKAFSGKLSLRISPILHEDAFNNSKELGISLNQYINDAISEYNIKCDSYFSRKERSVTDTLETHASDVIHLHKNKYKL